jgi:hypothetical protein
VDLRPYKINNAIGQALLAKRMGKTRIIAETGAGQHGVATQAISASGKPPTCSANCDFASLPITLWKSRTIIG